MCEFVLLRFSLAVLISRPRLVCIRLIAAILLVKINSSEELFWPSVLHLSKPPKTEQFFHPSSLYVKSQEATRTSAEKSAFNICNV